MLLVLLHPSCVLVQQHAVAAASVTNLIPLFARNMLYDERSQMDLVAGIADLLRVMQAVLLFPSTKSPSH